MPERAEIETALEAACKALRERVGYGEFADRDEADREDRRTLRVPVMRAIEAVDRVRGAPSRDGTVAVEDVTAWLNAWVDAHDAGDGTDDETLATFGFIAELRAALAEFGSARAGESNEGGNQ